TRPRTAPPPAPAQPSGGAGGGGARRELACSPVYCRLNPLKFVRINVHHERGGRELLRARERAQLPQEMAQLAAALALEHELHAMLALGPRQNGGCRTQHARGRVGGGSF